MPEMPEVETVRRKLVDSGLVGKKIESVKIFLPSIIEPKELANSSFIKDVEGATIKSCTRRGKYLIFSLDTRKEIVTHFRMTGKFLIVSKNDKRGPHEQVAFYFKNWDESLRFVDVRKFARIALTDDAMTLLSHLGPEPFECTLEQFSEIMKKQRGTLKSVLLDQKVIVGLGNIYCDEALFYAKIHPKRAANSLFSKELSELFSSIRKVLEEGIKNGGSSLGNGAGNFLNPAHERGANQGNFAAYKQTGSPCMRCKTPIAKIKISQRSTHFCPSCQK